MILDKYIPGFFGNVSQFCRKHSICMTRLDFEYGTKTPLEWLAYNDEDDGYWTENGEETDDELEEINDDERQDIINNSEDCKRLVSDIMFLCEQRRESFTDGEYLELCNKLMELNRRV